jgi:hypothetical protein
MALCILEIHPSSGKIMENGVQSEWDGFSVVVEVTGIPESESDRQKRARKDGRTLPC